MPRQKNTRSILGVLILSQLLSIPFLANAAEDSGFKFSGVVEVDHTSSNASGKKSTATGISTAEFGIAAKLGPFDINTVFLAEDIGLTNAADYYPNSGTDFRPDEMHLEELTIASEFGGMGVTIGQMTLPFGVFATSVVNDPATLQIGETKTRAGLMMSGKVGEKFEWNAGAFDGVHRSAASSESGFTANMALSLNDSATIGGGYITPQAATQGNPGLANIHTSKTFGKSTVSVEYVFAPVDKGGSRPSALSLDLGYKLNDKTTLGLHYDTAQQSSLLGGTGDYTGYGVGGAYKLKDNVILNLEYLNASEGSETLEHYKVMVAIEF